MIFLENSHIQEHVLQDEERGQDAHAGVQLAPAACREADQHVGDKAQQDAVGDAVGHRHEDDADERGDGIDILLDVQLLDVEHHHEAYQHQRRGCSFGRDGHEDGGEEERHQEADGRRERR